jgi:hypothetical protein
VQIRPMEPHSSRTGSRTGSATVDGGCRCNDLRSARHTRASRPESIGSPRLDSRVPIYRLAVRPIYSMSFHSNTPRSPSATQEVL